MSAPFLPAFASPSQTGMTLRDYFAGKALQASMINLSEQVIGNTPDDWRNFVAKDCYAIADAMLRARSE
jgi:hypothetical protein